MQDDDDANGYDNDDDEDDRHYHNFLYDQSYDDSKSGYDYDTSIQIKVLSRQ